MKRISDGLEMTGECFIEIVKIGARLFAFMEITFELPQQETAVCTTGGTRDVAGQAEASEQRRRHSKGLRR